VKREGELVKFIYHHDIVILLLLTRASQRGGRRRGKNSKGGKKGEEKKREISVAGCQLQLIFLFLCWPPPRVKGEKKIPLKEGGRKKRGRWRPDCPAFVRTGIERWKKKGGRRGKRTPSVRDSLKSIISLFGGTIGGEIRKKKGGGGKILQGEKEGEGQGGEKGAVIASTQMPFQIYYARRAFGKKKKKGKKIQDWGKKKKKREDLALTLLA